tara:strand:+ start:1761 stop:1958 length:198 start_codon:yes stop_codon:yes gene_type:complete
MPIGVIIKYACRTHLRARRKKIRLMKAGARAQRKVREVPPVLREKIRRKTELPPKTAARIAKKDA